jgi:multimeric flavodoxin WrbA
MKVIAFNGSPNAAGNTHQALRLVLEQLEAVGIETELIHIGKKAISGCVGCGGCAKNQDEKCVLPGDSVNDWVQKMKTADGILLGSPVHFAALAGNFKSFLDRAFYIATVNNSLFQHKVGASVVAVRRSGGLPTFEQLNNYLLYSQMVLPTSNYWNVIHGMRPGEVLQDAEGVQIMQVLGKNMAWLLQVINHSKHHIPAPAHTPKTMTNFIKN